jgi:hypothetical protein
MHTPAAIQFIATFSCSSSGSGSGSSSGSSTVERQWSNSRCVNRIEYNYQAHRSQRLLSDQDHRCPILLLLLFLLLFLLWRLLLLLLLLLLLFLLWRLLLLLLLLLLCLATGHVEDPLDSSTQPPILQ